MYKAKHNRPIVIVMTMPSCLIHKSINPSNEDEETNEGKRQQTQLQQ